MSFIHNIRSVAKYESKLLLRSWFFKIFTLLALFVLVFFNIISLIAEDSGGFWIVKAIASNVPYFNLILLNTGQAVIAVFLSSEFLKRDKKLDTSEVFYVHPLSNAEYVIGKIWGNLRIFFILNILILTVALAFNVSASGVGIDILSYLIYFLLISIPTLLFILGLSIFLMLLIKNQALTFVLLLGYIGMTIFYINDKFYYLFDYMAYNLPLMKSSIVGFTNMEAILTHRFIYLFAGLSFILFTVFMFRRLPNSSRKASVYLFAGFLVFCVSMACGYSHVNSFLGKNEIRKIYTDLNNKYVHTPKIVVDRYDISVEQHADSFSSEVEIKGAALQSSSTYTFSLNPGLEVKEVKEAGKRLKFKREKQIIQVDLGRTVQEGDSLSLLFTYGGKIDDKFLYLDIPDKQLEEPYKRLLLNIDKQYSFQRPNYVLLTPETYWYPRPGTAYSDESPDWQQTYFSKYNLKVKTLPGLVPLSQGEMTDDGKGTFTFKNDNISQSTSLVIGDYERKSIYASDSALLYNVCYLKGHDFFSAAFDSIKDTIPALLKEAKEGFEHTYKLSYPFKQFSIVEVPVQFFSYTRTWSQAQEMVQPEMVLFPEKGALFDMMDIKKRAKQHKQWAKWSGRGEIDDKESLVRTFIDLLWLFRREEGNSDFSSASRGQYKVTTQANPYFLFPQLYNFRYNIFSSEWPIANRMVEIYLQNKSGNYEWQRQINGLSNAEKANMLQEKQSLKELLTNVEFNDLQDDLLNLRINDLFAPAEINMGINHFRDSLYSVLARNTFRNIRFESLLDTLSAIGKVELSPRIAEWNHPTPLPLYVVNEPVITHIKNRGGVESFVIKILMRNDSDYDGFMLMTMGYGPSTDPKAYRKIKLEAHQAKELVSVWDNLPPRITLNMMIAGNLPYHIELPLNHVEQRNNREIDKEGDYVVSTSSFRIPGEIIIDNEDSTLFSLSKPAVIGLLPKLLDKVDNGSFKYGNVSPWRPPLEWTASTDMKFYGEYIRSAYLIKSGDGSQTATWKIPVPSPGRYDVYYYVYKDNELWWNRNAQAEYHFKVNYDGIMEDSYINLRKVDEGWEPIGVYSISSDTISVVLTNECKLRKVVADAIKIVKRY